MLGECISDLMLVGLGMGCGDGAWCRVLVKERFVAVYVYVCMRVCMCVCMYVWLCMYDHSDVIFESWDLVEQGVLGQVCTPRG